MEKYNSKTIEVKVSDIQENPWNPNRQSKAIFESIKKSVEKYGMLSNILVREYIGQYQIISGAHRWRACKELGYTTLKVENLGELSDEDAKVLTELMNVAGENDPLVEAKLWEDIQSNNYSLFPLTEKEIENKKSLLKFDFSKYEKEEVVEIERNRTIIFALSEQEYEVVKHCLGLTKKSQTEALMEIAKEYVQIREGMGGVDNSA